MKKRLFILLVASLVFVPQLAMAETSVQPRLDAIRQRCTVIQTILDQLQRRDLVARTNRGRAYEAQIKQIDALSQRLRVNNIPSATLDAPVVRFKAVVESFRAAYITYDDRMTALREIDCRNKTEEFALRLDELRVLRQAVGVEVAKGEEALSQYRTAVVELRTTVPEKRGNS